MKPRLPFIALLFCCAAGQLLCGYAQPRQKNIVAAPQASKWEEWTMPTTQTNILTEADKIRLIKIQGVMSALASLKQFSGVVLVAKQGQPIYKCINGFANLDYNIPNNLDCNYNTLHITQAFTAIAIMQLVESGQINLFAPIKSYLPELPAEIGNALTVHNLLTHTSGLLDYYQVPEYRENFLKIEKISDLVKLIGTQDRPCNTSVQQPSNSGYVLLAAIVERLSGMTYPDYIRRNLLKPANLQQADLYMWHEVVSNKAVGYLPDAKNELIASPDFMGAYPFGADGVYCSADELLKFSYALHEGKMLSLEAQKTLYDDYTLRENPADTSGISIGYGWKRKKIAGNNEVIFQGGSLGGLSTQLRRYNNDDYTVVVLCNYYNNTAEWVAERLERALFTSDYIVPKDPAAYYVSDLITDHGVNYVVEHIDALLAARNVKLEYVWSLNSLGYEFMYKRQYDTAETIFKANSRKFANDPIVYDSMGDLYFQTKKYDLSRHYFELKLQLAPNDQRAKNMFKEIEKMEKKTPSAKGGA